MPELQNATQAMKADEKADDTQDTNAGHKGDKLDKESKPKLESEPEPEPEPEPEASIREELLSIYEQHSPSKVPDVDGLLLKWRGEEQELLSSVRAKYTDGEETSTGESFSGRGTAAREPAPAAAAADRGSNGASRRGTESEPAAGRPLLALPPGPGDLDNLLSEAKRTATFLAAARSAADRLSPRPAQ